MVPSLTRGGLGRGLNDYLLNITRFASDEPCKQCSGCPGLVYRHFRVCLRCCFSFERVAGA